MKNGDFVNGAHSNNFDEETDDLGGLTLYMYYISGGTEQVLALHLPQFKRGFCFADGDSVDVLADRSRSKYPHWSFPLQIMHLKVFISMFSSPHDEMMSCLQKHA